MINFEYMQPAVDEICKSMAEDPDRWEITTYTVIDKTTKIEYWVDSCSITYMWDERKRNLVFSYLQGMKIYKAFDNMRNVKASSYQQKIIDKMKPKSEVLISYHPYDQDKKWWEFWK